MCNEESDRDSDEFMPDDYTTVQQEVFRSCDAPYPQSR